MGSGGVYALTSWGKRLLKQKEDIGSDEIGLPVQRLAVVFSALVIVMAIPAPILLSLFARSSSAVPPTLAQNLCKPDQQYLQGFVPRNASINLVPNEAVTESYMPVIRISDFQSALLNNFSDIPFLGQELQGLQAGQQISIGFNQNLGHYWLISNSPLGEGKFTSCGDPSKNQFLRSYGFYDLQGAAIRPPPLTLSQRYPGITLLFRLMYGFGAAIIIFLIALDMGKFRRRSVLENLYVIGATILILVGVFVALYAQAIIHIPFAEQRTILQVKDVVPKKPTHLYILPLGINWMNQADLGQSPAVVYENGIPLSSPNSLHQTIKDDGMGGYSIWNGNLYFSSSDNTDPRTNGRKYEIEWPHPLRPVLQWIAYIAGILGLVMLVLRVLLQSIGNWLNKKSDI